MALFRISRLAEPAPLARGDGLYLRSAQHVDYLAWATLREASREFLTPWEPSWPADDLTRGAFRRRLKRQADEIARDEAYSFLIFEDGSDNLLGGITIGGVRRGVAQAATLGYWIGAPYARRGHADESRPRPRLLSVSPPCGCIRIEAACIPDKYASSRVLERNGFQKEGFARAYLRINGAWRDHLLFALLEGDARALSSGGRGVV